MTLSLSHFNEDNAMNEVTTRKWRNGELVEETKSRIDWKPNEADLDVVVIGCECGSKFNMPRDCLMFGFDDMYCGQCGKTGKMSVVDYNPPKPQAS
jgi:hypothetical protein